jgi:hypothetical protein
VGLRIQYIYLDVSKWIKFEPKYYRGLVDTLNQGAAVIPAQGFTEKFRVFTSPVQAVFGERTLPLRRLLFACRLRILTTIKIIIRKKRSDGWGAKFQSAGMEIVSADGRKIGAGSSREFEHWLTENTAKTFGIGNARVVHHLKPLTRENGKLWMNRFPRMGSAHLN